MTEDEPIGIDPEVRDIMVRRLLEQRSSAGKYPRGAIQRVADVCGVHRSVVYRWCEKGHARRPSREASRLDDIGRAAIIETNGDVAGAHDLLAQRGADVKSLRTFYRAVRRDPDAALVKYARLGAPGSRSERVALITPRGGPNARWELDHWSVPIELVLKAGDETTITANGTTVVDCDNGEILANAFSYPAPTRGTVLAVLRMAIEKYGIPDLVACDNTMTVTARAVRQVAAMLDFEICPLPPYSPDRKPSVESAIRTIKAQFCRRQPFYAKGARRQDRTLHGLEGSRLDLEMLTTRFAAFIEQHNEKVPVKGLRGRTRAQVRKERLGLVRFAPAEELRTLTLERFTRVIRKDGGIHIDGVAFFDPAMHACHKRTVRVGMMPGDYSRIEVWLDGKWLCTALPTRTLTEEQRDASRQEKARLNTDLGRLRRLANARRDRYAPVTSEEPVPRLIGRDAVLAAASTDDVTADPLGFGPEIGEVE